MPAGVPRIRAPFPSLRRIAAVTAGICGVFAALVFGLSGCSSEPSSISVYLSAMAGIEDSDVCGEEKFRLPDSFFNSEPRHFVFVCGENLHVWDAKERWHKRGIGKGWTLTAENPRAFPLAGIGIEFSVTLEEPPGNPRTWLPRLALSSRNHIWRWDFPSGGADKQEMRYLIGLLDDICRARHEERYGSSYPGDAWSDLFPEDLPLLSESLSNCQHPDSLFAPPSNKTEKHWHYSHSHPGGDTPHSHTGTIPERADDLATSRWISAS